MTRLLKIADQKEEPLNEYFEHVERVNIEEAAPTVLDDQPGLDLGGKTLDRFDAVFANIPVENAVFGRVMLEVIEEREISLNYTSTAFFTMAKKNYLFHVLKQQNVKSPKTAVVADQKATRNLERHLRGPLIAERIRNLKRVESTKIDSVEDIQGFAEGVKYDQDILMFSELSPGEKYRCLVAGENIVSLQDTSEGWEISSENLSYSNLSGEEERTVKHAVEALGASVAVVDLRDGEVVNVRPNPDLEMFSELSGGNTYKAVAEALKG